MTKKKQKDFDAVKMMREIRDDLSRKLMTMSHEEQQRYIKEQLAARGRSLVGRVGSAVGRDARRR